MGFLFGPIHCPRVETYKAHFVTFEKKNSLMTPAKSLEQIPLVYSLNMDPKEMHNILDRSGGTPVFEPMMKSVAPYLASFQKWPNKNYSKMTRSK